MNDITGGTMLKIRIKPGNISGCYDLLVNGNTYLRNESMQVCDNVEAAIISKHCGITEADEIAESILRKEAK